MDPLHMKVGSDLLSSMSAEDEFYNRHSCDWLRFFRLRMIRTRQHNAYEPCVIKTLGKPIGRKRHDTIK